MSAVRSDPPADDAPPAALRTIALDVLDAVLAIEVQAYTFPWTRGNFVDSIAAGYVTRALQAADGSLLGYFVAMPGFEEIHLLNLTVAPSHQRRGHARRMLAHLYALSREGGATAIWLEVRETNGGARQLYLSEGFVEAGRRRGYYPAPQGQREDAILMSKALGARSTPP